MSTERFTFPVQDPERIMRRRRRQALRRQAPAPVSPESDSVTDGIESESSDDESSTNASGQAQTQPPPASTSSISSPPVIPTLVSSNLLILCIQNSFDCRLLFSHQRKRHC